MKRGEIYTSGWLKAPDLLAAGHGRGLDLTIKSVQTKTMDDGTDQRSITFVEIDQALGLNATNWDSIAELTDKQDDDDWAGAVINAYPHKLDRPFNGKTHGIRIQRPQGVGPARSNAVMKAAAVAPNAAEDARKAAWNGLKGIMPPDATQGEVRDEWLKRVGQKYPGKPQITLTAAEWKAIEADFLNPSGYVGEPESAVKGVPPSDDIPF